MPSINLLHYDVLDPYLLFIQSFQNKNILKADIGVSPQLIDAAAKIKAEHTRQDLSHALARRPERVDLESKNIIKHGTEGMEAVAVAALEISRKKMLISKLERGMNPSLRPTLTELEKRGVVKEFTMERSDNFTQEEAHALLVKIFNKGGKVRENNYHPILLLLYMLLFHAILFY